MKGELAIESPLTTRRPARRGWELACNAEAPLRLRADGGVVYRRCVLYASHKRLEPGSRHRCREVAHDEFWRRRGGEVVAVRSEHLGKEQRR